MPHPSQTTHRASRRAAQCAFAIAALMLVLCMWALPQRAWADDTSGDTTEIVAAEDENGTYYIAGDFTIRGGEPNVDFTYVDNALSVISEKPVTIGMNAESANLDENGATTTDRLVSAPTDGFTSNITIDGVKVDFSHKSLPPFQILNGAANVTLAEGSENEFTSGNVDTPYNRENHRAAIETGACPITIDAEGEGETEGSLKAISKGAGAGIGGILATGNGPITINGGVIEARSLDQGAGIGTAGTDAWDRASNATNITINGGTVYAYGGSAYDGLYTWYGGGAGIGGGVGSGASDITITGGEVHAFGGLGAAGIGGGHAAVSLRPDASNITISGGKVYAEAGPGAGSRMGAAIGGGGGWGVGITDVYNTNPGCVTNIVISGGYIYARPVDGHPDTTTIGAGRYSGQSPEEQAEQVHITGGVFLDPFTEGEAENAIFDRTAEEGYVVVENLDPETAEAGYVKLVLPLSQAPFIDTLPVEPGPVYDGEPVELSDVALFLAAGKDVTDDIPATWFAQDGTELAEAPTEVGDYRVEVSLALEQQGTLDPVTAHLNGEDGTADGGIYQLPFTYEQDFSIVPDTTSTAFTLVNGATVAYDGMPLDASDLVARASYGQTEADAVRDITFSYAPLPEEGLPSDEDFMDGAPTTPGTYMIRATLAARVVDGVSYEAATAQTVATINARSIELVWRGAEDRVYDGNPSAVRADFANADQLASDVGKLSLSVTGGDATRPGRHTATATLSGEAAEYYVLTNPEINYTITQIPVPVDGWTEDTVWRIDVPVSSAGATDVQVNLPVLFDGARVVNVIVVPQGGDVVPIMNEYASEDGKTLHFDAGASTAGSQSVIKISTDGGYYYEDIRLEIIVTSIDKQVATISGVSAEEDLVYNGESQQGYTGEPVVSGGWQGNLDVTYYEGPAVSGKKLEEAPKDAGVYTVRFSVPDDDPACTGFVDIPFQIAKKPVTIRSISWTIPYGEGHNVAHSISGLLENGSTTEEAFDEPLKWYCAYVSYKDAVETGQRPSPIGEYVLMPYGASAKNYTFKYFPGTITVKPREVSLEWGNYENRMEGDELGPVTCELAGMSDKTGVLPGDDVYVTLTDAEAEAPGEHTATATLAGAQANNYMIDGEATLAYAVEENPELDDGGSVLELKSELLFAYDGAALKAADVVERAAYGKVEADLARDVTLSYAAKSAEGEPADEDFAEGLPRDAGSYVVRADLDAREIDGVAYEAKTAEADVTIEPRALELVWAGGEERTYDGTASAVTATFADGAIFEVDAGKVTLEVTGGDAVDAGEYTATATLSGEASDNYVLANGELAYTILRAQATDEMKHYEIEVSTSAAELMEIELPCVPEGTLCNIEPEEVTGNLNYALCMVRDGVLILSTAENTAGAQGIFPLRVTNAKNYEDYTITLTVTAVDDDEPGTDPDQPGGDEPVTGESTLELVDGATFTYDGAALNVTDVVECAAYGEAEANLAQDVTFSYAANPAEGEPAEEDFAEGLPCDAGGYVVRAVLAEREIDGVAYEAKTAQADVTIKPREAELSWTGTAERAYDSTASVVTAAFVDGAIREVDADKVTLEVIGGDAVDAGEYTATATLSGEAAGNYVLANPQVAYIILKAEVSEAVKSVEAQVSMGGAVGAQVMLPSIPEGAAYGSISTSGDIALSGMSIQGNMLSFDAAESAEGAQGAIVINVTGAKNYEDYQVVVTVTATAKQVVTITGVSAAKGLVYSGQPQVGYTGEPAVSGDWSGELVVTYYEGSVADGNVLQGEPTNAGAYTVRIAVPDDPDFTGFVDISFEIGRASLTVSANDAAMIYGDSMPEFGVSYDGFVNGEDASVFSGTLTIDCAYVPYDEQARGGHSPAGVYLITPSGLTSDNYAISFASGTLTVSPREVTLAWGNYEGRVEGDGLGSVTCEPEGLLSGDDVRIELTDAEAATAGEHAATAALAGEDAASYVIAGDATLAYTVAEASEPGGGEEPGGDPDEPGTDPDQPGGEDPDQPGTDPDQPGGEEPGGDSDEPGSGEGGTESSGTSPDNADNADKGGEQGQFAPTSDAAAPLAAAAATIAVGAAAAVFVMRRKLG